MPVLELLLERHDHARKRLSRGTRGDKRLLCVPAKIWFAVDLADKGIRAVDAVRGMFVGSPPAIEALQQATSQTPAPKPSNPRRRRRRSTKTASLEPLESPPQCVQIALAGLCRGRLLDGVSSDDRGHSIAARVSKFGL
jgi:hypothetical protein